VHINLVEFYAFDLPISSVFLPSVYAYCANWDAPVVLTLRKRLPTLRDSQDLARLHELIIATQTSLAQRRRSQLERLNTQILHHQAAIKSLEQERDELLTNKALLQLKTNFIHTQEHHSWMEPNLSVYLF
jgi:hypothetical protein